MPQICSPGVCELFLVFHGGYNWGMTNSLSPRPTVENIIANIKLSFRKKLRDWSGLDGFYFRGSCSLGEDGEFSQHLDWSNTAPQDASDCQDFQMIPLSWFRHQKLLPRWSWAWEFQPCGQIPSSFVTNDCYASIPKSICMHCFDCTAQES